jgi:FtsZ-interacting cell division protein ZipA
MNTAVWIVIAVVVVLLVIALIALLTRKRRAQRRVEAGQIREEASHRVNEVQRREAIAEESAAKARRAQADAEAKAAEAKRLQHEAQSQQGHAASSRQELDAEFQRADKLDPDVPRSGRHEGDVQDVNDQNVNDQNVNDQRGGQAPPTVPNGGNRGGGVNLDPNGQTPRQDGQPGRHAPH